MIIRETEEGLIMSRFLRVVSTIVFCSAVATGIAQADITGTLTLGSNYSTMISGGSINPSYWNGSSLAFVYCIDVPDEVLVPGTYATVATDDGIVTSTRGEENGKTQQILTAYVGFGDILSADNQTAAIEIAYLLHTYALPDTGNNSLNELALQEAIWKAVYGKDFFYGDPTILSGNVASTADTLFNAASTTGLTTNYVSDYLWFSPGQAANPTTLNQALVGKVPEPSTILALGAFLLVGLTAGLWKRRSA